MGERGFEPSAADRGFVAPDVGGQQTDKKSGKMVRRLTHAAKVGAVAAGVAFIEGPDSVEHHEGEATWSTLVDLVRTEIHAAVENGTARRLIEQFMEKVFTLLRDAQAQHKEPGAVREEINSLGSQVFNNESTGGAVNENGAETEDIEIAKAEIEREFEGLAAQFESDAGQTEKLD